MNYKVLTLTPPWGTLIALGAKKIETRSWKDPYRGKLLIHQGSNLKPIGGEQGLMELCRTEPFRSVLVGAGYLGTPALPRGAIVAVCELVDIARIDLYQDDEWEGPVLNYGGRMEYLPDEPELSFGDYSVGRYAWLLADIRALPEPIATRGYQGLWEWEGELNL